MESSLEVEVELETHNRGALLIIHRMPGSLNCWQEGKEGWCFPFGNVPVIKQPELRHNHQKSILSNSSKHTSSSFGCVCVCRRWGVTLVNEPKEKKNPARGETKSNAAASTSHTTGKEVRVKQEKSKITIITSDKGSRYLIFDRK